MHPEHLRTICSQAMEDAMAAEMADLRHAAAEVEAERDEAGEEVGRLGAELDRLQQEWASDSAEFKVRTAVLGGGLPACTQESGGRS
jgi:hypothetical protein